MTAATTAATALVIVESHFGNTRTIARAVAAGLADAIASLPPRYREVLLLKYYNGYSAREIAGFLSATPDAVTQTLHRARKKLAEILDERGETP